MFPATFRRLEVFLTVVDAGSMHGAADRLSISQPSVSDHIHALEHQLGQTLFERRRGATVNLTEEGRRLYRSGTELVTQINEMTTNLGIARKSSRKRRFTIIAQRSIANFLLCEPIANFARLREDVEIIFKAGSYEYVVSELLHGHADLGYVFAAGAVIDLPSEIVGQERLGFYAGSNHPLARRTRVEIADLVSRPFICADKSSHFWQMVDTVLTSAGITGLQVACQAQEVSIVRALVSRGIGISCSIACSMTEAVRRGELVELHVNCPELFVNIHQTFAAGRRPSSLAINFADALKGMKVFENFPRQKA
jgi:DNA-binding transcriptional LysR family regulator